MDGIHDLGGREGFGPVLGSAPAPTWRQEVRFQADWERTAFGLVEVLVGGGFFSVDRFRHAVERVEPVAYLGAGYYGRWFAALEILLHEAGVLRHAGSPSCPPDVERVAAAKAAARRLSKSREASSRSSTAQRSIETAPKFRVGDPVRTRHLHRSGHCRLPGYARGRSGTVVDVHPAFVYPDTNAHGLGEHPQHLYSVQFCSEELWGDACEPGTLVSLDLFEPYLEGSGRDPADIDPVDRSPSW